MRKGFCRTSCGWLFGFHGREHECAPLGCICREGSCQDGPKPDVHPSGSPCKREYKSTRAQIYEKRQANNI